MGYISRTAPYYKEMYDLYRYMHTRVNITPICPEWNDFGNFYNDMIDKFTKRKELYPNRVMTVDRLNYNGIYEPSNCRILPREAQSGNKSDNVIYYLYNQRWTQSQLYRAFALPGVSLKLFMTRVQNGWDLMDALRVPQEFGYVKESYEYRKFPVMDIDELFKKHTESQFLSIRDDNELFNYDPKDIKKIDEELGRNQKK